MRDDVERIAHAGGEDISRNASQEEVGHLDKSDHYSSHQTNTLHLHYTICNHSLKKQVHFNQEYTTIPLFTLTLYDYQLLSAASRFP